MSKGDERMTSEIMQLIKDLEETLEIMNKKREETLIKIQRLYEQLVKNYNDTTKKVGRLSALVSSYIERILRFISKITDEDFSIEVKDIVNIYDIDENLNIKVRPLKIVRITEYDGNVEVEYEDDRYAYRLTCFTINYRYELKDGLRCLQILLSEKVLKKIAVTLEKLIDKLTEIQQLVESIENSDEIKTLIRLRGG